MIRCLHCSAETSNGLALCDLCSRQAALYFEFLPVYFRNLARWRPGRAGARPVPGSRVLYDGGEARLGTGDRISDTLDETVTALTTWARAFTQARAFPRPLTLADAVLRDDLPIELAEILNDDQPTLVAMLCLGLEHHLTSISTTDWCGEFVRDLGEHEARLRGLTEVAVPGWYAGACRGRGCSSSTYVVPGLTWVTCRACGSTTAARDHLDVVIDEAGDWIAKPKQIAEAVVALVDTEMSVPRLYARIRQWAAREELEPIRRTVRGYSWSESAGRFVVADEEVGHARYRLGDVLTKVLTRVATRESGEDRDKAAAVS